MKNLIQPQADALLALLQHGGVVPTSEWTNGSGRYTTRRTVPPHASRLTVREARESLRGEVRRAFDRLVKARPRVACVVAVIDLRGARRALRLKGEAQRAKDAPRFVVEACDNCGTVEGLNRDRTWLVMEVSPAGRVCVGDYDTRAEAYAGKRECDVEVKS